MTPAVVKPTLVVAAGQSSSLISKVLRGVSAAGNGSHVDRLVAGFVADGTGGRSHRGMQVYSAARCRQSHITSGKQKSTGH